MLTGLMMTVAIVAVVVRPREAEPVSSTAATSSGDRQIVEAERCRNATVPDAACEAIWAERRRRFFGNEGESE
jgi:conjugative transfer region protein TrbK